MAEMTREQLQGAVMALDNMLKNVGLSVFAERWAFEKLTKHRSQLTAMPPQPDLRALLVEARAALDKLIDPLCECDGCMEGFDVVARIDAVLGKVKL